MATAVEQQVNEAKVEEFVGKMVEDFSGAAVTYQCVVGDKLGLFKALADRGPATPADLADRAGIDERYALEWLSCLTAAGYLSYQGENGNGRYSIPPEHVPALAHEGGPVFMCGGYQSLLGMMQPMDRLLEAFRSGGGIAQDEYPEDAYTGMRRFTGGWHENLLLQEWIPSLPEVQAKLEAGCDYADVGCGAGAALVKLAQAFPNSRFVGYDAFEGQLELAREEIERAGVSDRVRFELLDVATGLPEKFDVISTYDVVHDSADPAGLVKAIRNGLKEDGVYLCLEINCADDRADNVGPLAALFYGFSISYCMTTSLAQGGAGLGTCGCPEAKMRELAEGAGFGSVERAPITENPFNVLYALRP